MTILLDKTFLLMADCLRCNFMKDLINKIIIKPWGYEYLVYENEDVALWLLHIAAGQQTSMHCHPTKTTGLVLLAGIAELSFLADKKLIQAPEKQMIRRGLFHSTKAISPEGILMFEIETPNDKDDLIRLSDKYGRVSSGYEGVNHEVKKNNQCIWIDELDLVTIREYSIDNVKFTVEKSSSIDSINYKGDDDILIFLKGGLGKNVGGRSQLATMPGDIGRAGVVKKVAGEMDFLEKNTLILTVQN
jgi:mannose-6-phosphate isomerase-like protein (cupin superfamily)